MSGLLVPVSPDASAAATAASAAGGAGGGAATAAPAVKAGVATALAALRRGRLEEEGVFAVAPRDRDGGSAAAAPLAPSSAVAAAGGDGDARLVSRYASLLRENAHLLSSLFKHRNNITVFARVRPPTDEELRGGPPARTRGQWRKVTLWKEELYGLSGPALFIDLDSVIVDNLDPYFTYGDPDDVILARNWARPLQRLGQTSVFRFPIGRNGHVLRNFEANPQGVADQFRYEQHFVTHSIGSRLKFWPPSWTRHFRLHCLGSLPMRYLREARLPRTARIVTFAGGPNPSDVVDGRWSPYSPPYGGVWTHLRRTFDRSARRGTWWRHLKQFVRPCGWIRELWRD